MHITYYQNTYYILPKYILHTTKIHITYYQNTYYILPKYILHITKIHITYYQNTYYILPILRQLTLNVINNNPYISLLQFGASAT